MRVTAILVCCALAACSSEKTQSASSGDSAALKVAACVERGVAYFEKIGSYPVLHEPPNAGRAAEEVAQERCERTLAAFS